MKADTISRSVQIDEDGFILALGLRVQDPEYGRVVLDNIRRDGHRYLSTYNSETIRIESFDDPLVARQCRYIGDEWLEIELPYALKKNVSLKTLRVDSWDRFHGRTSENVSFVMSNQAQMDLFNSASSFNDDSLELGGVHYSIPSMDEVDNKVSSATYWNEHYQEWNQGTKIPGWDLDGPAKPLFSILPQIKIPKSRICVVGAGAAHDAAFLAEQGHIVTAVDFSELAIARARERYGNVQNLKFVCDDFFKFCKSHHEQFDLVFEHTFFCAIHPSRRQEVIKAWKSVLTPQGQLLAIFFVITNDEGPPFGATEWELRQRLRPDFDFLYWTRWQQSIPSREGAELVVFARIR